MSWRPIQVTKFLPMRDNSTLSCYSRGEKLKKFFNEHLEGEFDRLKKTGEKDGYEVWYQSPRGIKYKDLKRINFKNNVRLAIFRSEKEVGETYDFSIDYHMGI